MDVRKDGGGQTVRKYSTDVFQHLLVDRNQAIFLSFMVPIAVFIFDPFGNGVVR